MSVCAGAPAGGTGRRMPDQMAGNGQAKVFEPVSTAGTVTPVSGDGRRLRDRERKRKGGRRPAGLKSSGVHEHTFFAGSAMKKVSNSLCMK